jgi:Rrf2 family transcriptional regulator, iron-sulfur cluster assembly transcription factor
MQMTTKGRFAVVAMMDVAVRSTNDPISLSAIARRRKISLSYLEQLFGKLRRSGLVRSVRGPGGGYVLALPAASISVADIVIAVDDSTELGQDDMDDEFEQGKGRCDTSQLWRDIHAKAIEILGAISLKSLALQQQRNVPPAEEKPRHRGISSEPVVKRIRTTAPNSVFSLGASLSKAHGTA